MAWEPINRKSEVSQRGDATERCVDEFMKIMSCGAVRKWVVVALTIGGGRGAARHLERARRGLSE